LALCWADALVELANSLDGGLTFNRLKCAWLQAGQRIDTVDIDGAFGLTSTRRRTAGGRSPSS
jgi:hypothetical protein